MRDEGAHESIRWRSNQVASIDLVHLQELNVAEAKRSAVCSYFWDLKQKFQNQKFENFKVYGASTESDQTYQLKQSIYTKHEMIRPKSSHLKNAACAWIWTHWHTVVDIPRLSLWHYSFECFFISTGQSLVSIILLKKMSCKNVPPLP